MLLSFLAIYYWVVFLQNVMVFARFPSAGCLSLWHVCSDNTDVLFSVHPNSNR